ncbi:MAG: 4Fe-4S dicluster domain-containing protein [Spirochaetota bacterium]|nr:MAG: 4Fe-4S dicluster domain-containing protein [Spirochaetota bacterium]
MNVQLSSEELDNEDIDKIIEISGANLFACYQCGKCTAGCPTSEFMDIPPHEVIRLLQFGQIEEILCKNTLWICASCITCAVRCPKGVDLSKIMEALRQIFLRKNVNYVHPNEVPNEELQTLPQIALIANFRKFTH